MQSIGTCHAWRSPRRDAKAILLTLDPSRELNAYPGIVIFRNGEEAHGVLHTVENLERELPVLLASLETTPTVYWSLQFDSTKRLGLEAELTARPEFVG